MTLFTLVSWWYTTGWSGLAGQASQRTSRLLETFSVGLLFGSLFEPFRQISAGQVRGGSFDAQIRALADRIFSRLFGAVVRSLFICIGLLAACASMVFSLAQMILWPIVPLLPLIGLAMALLKVGL